MRQRLHLVEYLNIHLHGNLNMILYVVSDLIDSLTRCYMLFANRKSSWLLLHISIMLQITGLIEFRNCHDIVLL